MALTTTIPLTGMTYIAGKVARAENRGRAVAVRFIVDSGAMKLMLASMAPAAA